MNVWLEKSSINTQCLMYTGKSSMNTQRFMYTRKSSINTQYNYNKRENIVHHTSEKERQNDK